MEIADNGDGQSSQKTVDLKETTIPTAPDISATTTTGEEQVPSVKNAAPDSQVLEASGAESQKPEDKLLQLSTDELERLSGIVRAVYHSDQFKNGDWKKWCTKIGEINFSDQRHGLDKARGENFRKEHRVWEILRNHGLSHDWRPKSLMRGLQLRIVNGYADNARGSYFDKHQKPVNDQERQAIYSNELTTSYWKLAGNPKAVNLKTGITVGDFFTELSRNPNATYLNQLLRYPESKGDLEDAIITISGAIQSKEIGSTTFQESKYKNVDLENLPPLRKDEFDKYFPQNPELK